MLLIGEGTWPCKGFLETLAVVYVRALVYYCYFFNKKSLKKNATYFFIFNLGARLMATLEPSLFIRFDEWRK